jgi:mono/diheme cytochrome c family protein
MEKQMSRRPHIITAAFVLSALLPLIAQKGPSPKSDAARPESTQSTQKPEESRGQRVFRQNCARCHDAPQSFPPSVSGTILRHMRVRASLSAQDEKAVMEFMNP